MAKKKKDNSVEDIEIDEQIFLENGLFLGDRGILFPVVKNKVKNFYENQNVFDKKEVLFFEIEKLNISVDDIRRMISFVNKSHEGKKVVLLSSFYWGGEAQNAMLKVLEETPDNTVIFLFGLNKKTFLKTILSRVQQSNFQNLNRYLALADDILQIHPNERLENKNVKKILGLKVVDYNYEKDLEVEKKDREAHILFLYALLDNILDRKKVLKEDFLKKILKISTLAEIEGGSPHLFIEWLLLSTPKLD